MYPPTPFRGLTRRGCLKLISPPEMVPLPPQKSAQRVSLFSSGTTQGCSRNCPDHIVSNTCLRKPQNVFFPPKNELPGRPKSLKTVLGSSKIDITLEAHETALSYAPSAVLTPKSDPKTAPKSLSRTGSNALSPSWPFEFPNFTTWEPPPRPC